MNRYRQTNLILSTAKNYSQRKRMYRTVKYPRVPLSNTDIYVYAEEGDRFDQLAEEPKYKSDKDFKDVKIEITNN
jgi:hypothetical protein